MSESTASALPAPEVGSAYRHGWRTLWKNILELLLILVLFLFIRIPDNGVSAALNMGGTLVLLSLVWIALVSWPVGYGVSYAYLRAARGDQVQVKDLFAAFGNYLNAVLANLLSTAIIALGFALLIVPGLYFACKLAFVPYLVVDRNMEAVEAVKESWRLTGGHGWTIFFVGLLGALIGLAGLLCLVVGVVISILWIGLAFAALYQAVAGAEAPAAATRAPES